MTNNLVNYIKWRGDLSFRERAFNDIDALVLCQIAYLNFDGILQPGIKSEHTVSSLWNAFKNDSDFEKRSDLGALINKDTFHVLEVAAESRRYSDIRLSCYVNKVDIASEEQFSAVTYFLTKKNRDPIVVFRGTDDTIVGWKEDFNMAFLEAVPAQKDAVSYLEKISAAFRGKVSVAGHSKGGNLSIYAAAFSNSRTKKHLKAVYNFDGPGFPDRFFKSDEFLSIIPYVKTYYPECSLVGMFFSHDDRYTVVKSENSGAWQHDPVSWLLEGENFATADKLDDKSITFNKIFNRWINSVEPQNLEIFIRTVFDAIENTGASTNSELESNFFDNLKKILKALKDVDKKSREEVIKMAMLFFSTAKDNFRK